MLLPAVYLSLLIVAFARTGSAAAIDSDLRNRDVPFKRAAPGWVNGAVNNFQGAVHNLPGFVAGTVGGAIDSAENHATALIPGGLIASAQNCPKIIEKTNWDKYLGVAPIATAINKPCPWVDTMTDLWDGIKCGGNCLLAFVQEDLNVLSDAHCAKCLGQVLFKTLPCINAAGGFQNICTKATAIPEFGPCLTGTKDTPGICPKPPASPRTGAS